MAILSFIFHQLFILLVPELVVWFEVVSDPNFPIEPDLVEKYLSILSHSVTVMNCPLITNPLP
jgi:hypothetical protein